LCAILQVAQWIILSLFQVLIKLKSTTTVGGPDESCNDLGLAYDGYGYNVSLPHFLGMLKTKSFGTFVDDIRSMLNARSEMQREQRLEEDMPDMSE
jgi:hypothetical protein